MYDFVNFVNNLNLKEHIIVDNVGNAFSKWIIIATFLINVSVSEITNSFFSLSFILLFSHPLSTSN